MSATNTIIQPPPPTNLVATDGDYTNGVQLSWSYSGSETILRWDIYRYSLGQAPTFFHSSFSTSFTFLDTSASPTSVYLYAVSAYSYFNGESTLSNEDIGWVTHSTIGTAANDVILGNDIADKIYGYAGNDQLYGMGGNDYIDGGDGFDTAYYKSFLKDASIVRQPDGSYIIATPLDGTDTLVSVEKFQFADLAITVTMKAEAAKLPIATVNSLIELYVAYFIRTPDATGLAYWIDKAAAGEILTDISKEFYNAGVQYSNLTGYSATMSNTDFIKLVYTNVLDRTGATAPPDADVAYWNKQITTGATTKEGLIQTMLAAAHTFANDPTWGWVPQLLNNKVTVGYQAAVTDGLDYNSPTDAITQGMAIAHAVTPTDTSVAVALIGVGANIHL